MAHGKVCGRLLSRTGFIITTSFGRLGQCALTAPTGPRPFHVLSSPLAGSSWCGGVKQSDQQLGRVEHKQSSTCDMSVCVIRFGRSRKKPCMLCVLISRMRFQVPSKLGPGMKTSAQLGTLFFCRTNTRWKINDQQRFRALILFKKPHLFASQSVSKAGHLATFGCPNGDVTSQKRPSGSFGI